MTPRDAPSPGAYLVPLSPTSPISDNTSVVALDDLKAKRFVLLSCEDDNIWDVDGGALMDLQGLSDEYPEIDEDTLERWTWELPDGGVLDLGFSGAEDGSRRSLIVCHDYEEEVLAVIGGMKKSESESRRMKCGSIYEAAAQVICEGCETDSSANVDVYPASGHNPYNNPGFEVSVVIDNGAARYDVMSPILSDLSFDGDLDTDDLATALAHAISEADQNLPEGES